MNQMTDLSVQVYRQTVRENPNFVSYLRTVTPELAATNATAWFTPSQTQS